MCCDDAPSAGESLAADTEIPTLEELEAELAQLGAAPEAADELELAAFDDVDTELEAAFAEFGAEVPTLEQVLQLAERYPGLKITLSY